MKESRRKPGKRLVLCMDSQQLQAAQVCPRSYWLAYVEHLRRIRPPRRLDGEPIAVNTGTLVHLVMNNVNRLKIAASKNRFQKLVPRFAVTNTSLLECGYRVIRRFPDLTDEQKLFHITKFTQFFAWDIAAGTYYKPLGTEVGFAKILYQDRDIIYIYEGRMDLIIRAELDGGNNVFDTWVDFKSTGRDSIMYANRNQFLGYSYAMDTNMGFVLSYGLQKEKKDPFAYKPVYHPQPLIDQWKRDSINTFHTVASHAPHGIEAFPRVRAACDGGQFGWCQFVKLCDNAHAPKVVQDGLVKIFYRKKVWSAWK